MATDGTTESASAVPESGQAALDNLSPEARASWELTGDWPEPAKVTTTADPEADEQDAAEAVAEAAPAVEAKAVPTPEKPVSKRQQQINDLIRSRAESDQRAAKLEAEIAELKARAAPAAEPKPAEKAPVVDPGDPEPTEDQFDTYKAFVKEQARWEIRQARREEKAAEAEAKAAEKQAADAAEFTTRTDTWAQRRDAFAAKTPEFTEKAKPFLDRVRAGTVIGDAILDSEVGPELALYLATHPDEVSRIVQLSPASALRALGKLEAQFDSEMTSASASAGPAARTVTKAPAPPTTLSARSADPADPVEAAVASKDFRAFEAEANRRDLAASR